MKQIILIILALTIFGCSEGFKKPKTLELKQQGNTTGGTGGTTGGTGSSTGGTGSGVGGCVDPNVEAFCRGGGQPPNVMSTIYAMADRYPGELSRCERNNYEFSHLVVNELRRTDQRWGLNWVRGNIGDETGDTIAYYYGPGAPQNDSPFVVVIDFIGACGGPSESVGWGAYIPESYEACCNPQPTARWTIAPL